MQRLAKAISGAGICSRRQAEELIINGKVKVDGVVVASPATLVNDSNNIEVDGKLIEPSQTPRLWTYYKPIGLITTHKDSQSRPTVFQALQKLPRVISVGRLDINSEGLLLLTNNGMLARTLELPATKLERVYKVRAHGSYNKMLARFPGNIAIEGIVYNIKAIKLIKRLNSNAWFEVTLIEGKNREIRKIFNHFGLEVNKLIRVSYGPFTLGNLQPGEHQEQPLASFKKFLIC